MQYRLSEQQCRNLDVSTRREWVLTNGIGGYAMGSASGINTRRYHGHLVAATKPPTERLVLLAGVDAFVQGSGPAIGLSTNQYPGAIYPEGFHYLRGFEIDSAAVWHFRAEGMHLVKSLLLHPGKNTVTVQYENAGEAPFTLTLRPLVSHKPHHDNFYESASYPDDLKFQSEDICITHHGVSLYICHPGADRNPVQGWYYRFEHLRELERGLPDRDDLFCPCELLYALSPGQKIAICASTELEHPAEIPVTESVKEHRLSMMLKAAAEKFFVKTESRTSIIAGFPWFTDWGRDTMISLPGLCLPTGRVDWAKDILRAYASQLRQGLIPNRFTEQGEEPDYNTVDATLWFVNAIYKTLAFEWDETFAREIWPSLVSIEDWHRKGTFFGIKVDAADGLLSQGEGTVQLTWMDAKIGDWVVTPRHGKPVEINGLWVNALRVMAWVGGKIGEDVSGLTAAADRAAISFESRFWHTGRGHYLDTVDPVDASLRPNQVLAMALPFSPVDPVHARLALEVVGRELLTTNGLRTLGPAEPGYEGRFEGPIHELDARYHQGTVWPWLMGSYATAITRYCDGRSEAKSLLRNAREMLTDFGFGGIAEVYDGDEPQSPAGCPWQAWSVAEYLRAWTEDIKDE